MKTHTKTINGTIVTAYKDSGTQWAVTVNGRTEWFDAREWTMKNAMVFMVELFGVYRD